MGASCSPQSALRPTFAIGSGLHRRSALRRLCGPPSIPLSFSLAAVVPRRCTHRVSSGTEERNHPPAPGAHRLRRGLPGYLIQFAPHALAPQRQVRARTSPAPLVFHPISTHFTAPPGIPLPSPCLQTRCLPWPAGVELPTVTRHIRPRLRALYAQSIRTTLAPSVLPRLLAQS